MSSSYAVPLTAGAHQDFAGDAPLVAVMRGDFIGSLHRGILAVADADGQLEASLGDTEQAVFLRSAAKPFQVMPAILSGGIERFGITPRELAVLCASHNAEPRHTETVLGILQKLDLDESALRCGVHPPIHEVTARQRWQQGLAPTPVCNNCSGAHTGMLVACRAHDWPIDSYGSPDHPLQRLTKRILADFVALPVQAIDIAVDNCRVPTFRVPVRRAAQAFARLGTGTSVGDELAAAAFQVVEAMTSHPEMVGGELRFDSDLMKAARGALVAKGGAEAFQGIGLRSTGLGLALKVSDGGDRAVAPAVVRVLEALSVLNAEQMDEIRRYREPIVMEIDGEAAARLTPLFDLLPSA